ncbi:MAG: ATPase with chaperone activity, partial [Planctomycetota bacterium]
MNPGTPAQTGQSPSNDAKLDELLNRIHSLSSDAASPAAPPAPERSAPAPVSAPPPPPPVPGVTTATPVPADAPGPLRRAAGAPASRAAPAPANTPHAQSVPERPRRPKMPDVLGFTPSRDEPWRPVEPSNLEESKISEALLEQLILRFMLSNGESEGRAIAEQLKLAFRLIEPILTRLKMEQHVTYRNATSTNDYIYVLSETGRTLARNHNMDCTYYGSCPVRLQEYIESVKRQTVEGQFPKKADLQKAFSDLLINEKMLHRLGPAVASGRGMFLYGFPGNGKTSIAERVTGAFGKYVWIPRAVEIDGEIMRVFDPMNHEIAMPESTGGLLDIGGFDKRW